MPGSEPTCAAVGDRSTYRLTPPRTPTMPVTSPDNADRRFRWRWSVRIRWSLQRGCVGTLPENVRSPRPRTAGWTRATSHQPGAPSDCRSRWRAFGRRARVEHWVSAAVAPTHVCPAQLGVPKVRAAQFGPKPRSQGVLSPFQKDGRLGARPPGIEPGTRRVSSDNQDENVATIKVRTRGRDATSARTMAVAGERGKWERGSGVSGTAGMRRPAARTRGVFHRPVAASVASRDGAVEGGFSEG